MNSDISAILIGKLFDPIDHKVKFIVQLTGNDCVWRGISYFVITSSQKLSTILPAVEFS